MSVQVLFEDGGDFSEQLLQLLDLLFVQITFDRHAKLLFQRKLGILRFNIHCLAIALDVGLVVHCAEVGFKIRGEGNGVTFCRRDRRPAKSLETATPLTLVSNREVPAPFAEDRLKNCWGSTWVRAWTGMKRLLDWLIWSVWSVRSI